MKSFRLPLKAACTIAAVAGLLSVSFALPAAASSRSVTGTVIAQNGLAVRKVFKFGGPVPENAPVNYYLSYGDQRTVSCWMNGPWVTGPYGQTDAWDAIYHSEGHVGVVSDAWMYTGGDIRNQVDHC